MDSRSPDRHHSAVELLSLDHAADFAMFSPEGNAAVAALVRGVIEAMRERRPATRLLRDFSHEVAVVAAHHPEITDTAVREAIYRALDQAGVAAAMQDRLIERMTNPS